MPAVFLDRDDTLLATREATAGSAAPGDLFDPVLVALLPGVGPALRSLAQAGFPLVVVTNQGALAAGRCTLRDVEATNDRMRQLLGAFGVTLAGVYLAPARPSGTVERFNRDPHAWRKPGGGMFLAAAAELNLDLARSWMIGDAQRDLDAAIAAGIDSARCLRVGTPQAPDMAAACVKVLAGMGHPAGNA